MGKSSVTKKHKTRLRPWVKFSIVGIFLLGLFAVLGYAMSILTAYQHNELDTSDLGISQVEGITDDGSSDIVNIALFGVDKRSDEKQVHSDSIMILSVDRTHNKIKLTSLMRDTYVSIEGHGQTKLTQAYFYGDAQLAVKTINQNFGTNITEYATINFDGMAQIIDAAGGVTVDVSEAERVAANESIREQALKTGLDEDYIEQAGSQVLSGTQAVAYARIRKVGNADFDRTERQRIVMHALFEKALAMSPASYPEFARKTLPYVETSIDLGQVLSLSGIMLRDVTMEEMRIPLNRHLIGEGAIYDSLGQQCLNVDLSEAAKTWKEFVYDDVDPKELEKGDPSDLTSSER